MEGSPVLNLFNFNDSYLKISLKNRLRPYDLALLDYYENDSIICIYLYFRLYRYLLVKVRTKNSIYRKTRLIFVIRLTL
jgi:hypothetical protein